MRSLSITGHWNVSLPSGVSPWNRIFGPGRGSKYNILSMRFVSIHVVHLYSSIDTTVAWKKFRFIRSDRSDFYMIYNLSIAVLVFVRCILISLSVDKTMLPRYVNLSTNFRESQFRMEMAHSWLRHMYSVLSTFLWRLPAPCSRLSSWDSAWVGVFARSAISSAKSESVIVSTRYRLPLAFFSVKPFSFIRSIDVLST